MGSSSTTVRYRTRRRIGSSSGGRRGVAVRPARASETAVVYGRPSRNGVDGLYGLRGGLAPISPRWPGNRLASAVCTSLAYSGSTRRLLRVRQRPAPRIGERAWRPRRNATVSLWPSRPILYRSPRCRLRNSACSISTGCFGKVVTVSGADASPHFAGYPRSRSPCLRRPVRRTRVRRPLLRLLRISLPAPPLSVREALAQGRSRG